MSLLMVACLGLTGCAGSGADKGIFDAEKHDFHDKKQKLSREDYRNMTREELDQLKPHFDGPPTTKVELGEPPIPEVSQILAAPRPPQIGETKLVSIFVTNDVPLQDVLIELARLADVDVEIDAGIQGGIVFRAQNRPFNEVVERISKLAGLQYSMENGTLHFMRDAPVVKTYSLDFLSFDRTTSSDMNVSTAVLSSSGGNGALNSGSSAAVTYSNESDFWTQMSTAVESILGYHQANGSVQADAPTSGAEGDEDETFFVINRQAGTLTVSGLSYHQQMVQSYLAKLQEMVSSQVLIEAKIIEVTLDEQYRAGISWDEILRSKYVTIGAQYDTVENTGKNITQILLSDDGMNSIDAIVSLTEQFGTTRTLSSPRIHAMNNQQAVLTFAQNVVYFDINVEEETEPNDNGPDTRTYTFESDVVTVPVGIIMTLQPSINMRTQEISLSVRPTITRIARFRSDPVVALLLARLGSTGGSTSIENEIPEIIVRELDSLVRMKSGQVMVLGGLMDMKGDSTENGIPYASGIPWIGNAFKGVARNEKVVELFFLIKATIVGTHTDADAADKTVYKKFITDHRPLGF